MRVAFPALEIKDKNGYDPAHVATQCRAPIACLIKFLLVLGTVCPRGRYFGKRNREFGQLRGGPASQTTACIWAFGRMLAL